VTIKDLGRWESLEMVQRHAEVVFGAISFIVDLDHRSKMATPCALATASVELAWALGRIGDTQAVHPLIDMLRDEDGYVRWHAAEVLGMIGDAQVVHPLIDLLRDEDQYVREKAAAAIRTISYQKKLFVPKPRKPWKRKRK